MSDKLTKTIAKINKKFGENTIGKIGKMPTVKTDRVSSGSPYLDWCVTGDTEIFDYNSGLPLKIKDIVENRVPAKVISFKKNNNSFGKSYSDFNFSSASNWFKRPQKQETIKISTSYGIPISVTHEHQLLTNKGWKKAKELKIGDYLVKPYSFNISLGDKRIDRFDKNYVRFLGYWLGDGYSDFGKTPTIASTDKDIIKDLHRIAKSKNYKLTHIKPISYNFTDKLPLKRSWNGTVIETNKFNLFLKDLNLLGKHRRNKIIPKEIFSLRKKYIAEILLGLFMSDGTVNKSKPTIEFCNISEVLVKQIHFLLLVSGVHSRIWKQERKGKHPLWILSINGINNLRSFQKITTLIGQKKKKLDYWCKKSIRKDRKGKRKKFGKDAICEKIVKIEKNGLQTVYDLTVEKEHNYLANGYICHNCIGGGWPLGKTIELYGPYSSGKSLIALRTIAEAQKKNYSCVYLDAENAFDPDFAELIGVDVDKLTISQVSAGEEVFDIIDLLLESDVAVIVVDSVASLVPQYEIKESMEKQTMALQARLMSKALRKITGKAAKNKTLIFFINQIREKISSYGNPETTSGGRALGFYSSLRVAIRRGDLLKDNKKVIGQEVKFKVTKSKVCQPYRDGYFIFYHPDKSNPDLELFDTADELVSMLLIEGKIERRGAYYYVNEKENYQGREELEQEIRTNDKLREKLMEKLT